MAFPYLKLSAQDSPKEVSSTSRTQGMKISQKSPAECLFYGASGCDSTGLWGSVVRTNGSATSLALRFNHHKSQVSGEKWLPRLDKSTQGRHETSKGSQNHPLQTITELSGGSSSSGYLLWASGACGPVLPSPVALTHCCAGRNNCSTTGQDSNNNYSEMGKPSLESPTSGRSQRKKGKKSEMKAAAKSGGKKGSGSSDESEKKGKKKKGGKINEGAKEGKKKTGKGKIKGKKRKVKFPDEENEEVEPEVEPETPLTPTELKVAKVFDSLDLEKNGCLPLGLVRLGVAALELCPTEVQMLILEDEMTDDSEQRVVFRKNFINVLADVLDSRRYQMVSVKELLEAFSILDDKGRGYFTDNDLRTILAKEGEPLTAGEMRDMLDEGLNKEEHTFDYRDYVKLMTRGRSQLAYW